MASHLKFGGELLGVRREEKKPPRGTKVSTRPVKPSKKARLTRTGNGLGRSGKGGEVPREWEVEARPARSRFF